MKYLLTILFFYFFLSNNLMGQIKVEKDFYAFCSVSNVCGDGFLILKKDRTFILNYVRIVEGTPIGHSREFKGLYKMGMKKLELNVKSVNLVSDRMELIWEESKIRTKQPEYGNFPTDKLPISTKYKIVKKDKVFYLIDVDKFKSKKDFKHKKDWWDYIRFNSFYLVKGLNV